MIIQTTIINLKREIDTQVVVAKVEAEVEIKKDIIKIDTAKKKITITKTINIKQKMGTKEQ